MTETRIRAALRIVGFSCSPDKITELLGVLPTQFWNAGDTVKGTSMMRPTNGWELSSQISGDRDLSEHVSDVLCQINCSHQSFADFMQDGSTLISCVLYITGDDRPLVFFSNGIIKIIHQINAGIDIDIYHLSNEPTISVLPAQ